MGVQRSHRLQLHTCERGTGRGGAGVAPCRDAGPAPQSARMRSATDCPTDIIAPSPALATQ
jgi:hypothetical protein